MSRNSIPEEVYDNLVSTINKHLPLLHRYVEIRKKCLSLMKCTCMTCIPLWSRILE
ncbi:hypothetical protein PO124_22680 [Bacillus licheniformis]|nr:hypothetical protein [Bacillus licheniformis]